MNEDLLHLIGTARGVETRDLFKEITVSRDNGLWPRFEEQVQPSLF